MNTTNNNSNVSATNVPYRATLHPMLRSLWNIPHVIQIPDPMPPPRQVVQLLQQQLTRCETQLAALRQ
jgi:hypothetical protein